MAGTSLTKKGTRTAKKKANRAATDLVDQSPVRERVTTVGLDLPIWVALKQRVLEESISSPSPVTVGEVIRAALISYLDLEYEPEPRRRGRPRASDNEVVAQARKIVKAKRDRLTRLEADIPAAQPPRGRRR